MYKTELHVHTKESSRCGRAGAIDIVKLYKEKYAKKDCGYNFYGKPAEKIINEYFNKE